MHLLQILLNLINNAIKFTHQGSVRLCITGTASSAATVALRFVVSDTGIGIDKRDQHRIFNAFEQGDGSSTREYGGSGLGLSICRQLAHMMGGQLEVDSVLHSGSSFALSLELPSAQNCEEPAALDAQAAPLNAPGDASGAKHGGIDQ